MHSDYRELPAGERRKLWAICEYLRELHGRTKFFLRVILYLKNKLPVSCDENRSVSSEEYKGFFAGVLVEAHDVSHA